MTWRIIILAAALLLVALGTYAYRTAAFISGKTAKKWKLEMPHIRAVLDDLPCDVYFFASWGSYSHPVFPTRELSFEEALAGHYRAWLHRDGGVVRFMLFEGVRLERSPYAGEPPALEGEQAEALFALEEGGPAQRVPAEAALLADQELPDARFLHVKRAADGAPVAEVVSVRVALRYRYFYDQTGNITKAELSNFYGDTRTLVFTSH